MYKKTLKRHKLCEFETYNTQQGFEVRMLISDENDENNHQNTQECARNGKQPTCRNTGQGNTGPHQTRSRLHGPARDKMQSRLEMN